ncbi:MAG TPA: hypothetical protein VLE72_01745 [Candidatus Saccharimonadales bacterium]|nr:hypothetical protein [Candidatus Saccharimonadales bacterium]
MKSFTSFEQFRVINGQAPKVFHLGQAPKQLVFVASWHKNDPDDPMFSLIKNEFEQFKPDLVLHESYNWPVDGDIKLLIQGYGELAYVSRLAHDADIPYRSAESGMKEDHQAYVERYGEPLVLALYVFRQVWQYHRQQSKADTFAKEYKQVFEARFKNLGANNFNWSEIDQISRRELGIPFEPDDESIMRKFRAAVDPAQEGTIFNEISRYVNYIRDQGVLRKLAEAKKDYDRIFVVMGASHYYTIEQYLKEMFPS